MIQVFKKYKQAFYFILRFFVTYILFSFLYNIYLTSFANTPDDITRIVAEQSKYLVELLRYKVETKVYVGESFVRFLIEDQNVASIVEGCNAMSVFILFCSFIIAYKGSLKHTVLFILSGGLAIYLVNIIRVSILTVGLYEYPENKDFLHQILFPVIIYGMVFILWILWVNKYAKK